MSVVELSEKFLAKIAGWEVIKEARGKIATGKVLSSNWTPPLLNGVVQESTTTYRAGLVLKDAFDIENICSCRSARQWGTMCAHSIAVGLHVIRKREAPAQTLPATSTRQHFQKPPDSPAKPEVKRLRRAEPDAKDAEFLRIHVILPPNLAEGLARGKWMVFFEGETDSKRCPLNLFPLDRPFQFDPDDEALLTVLEDQFGQPPGAIQLEVTAWVRLLPELANHPRMTVAKKEPVVVREDPLPLPLKLRLMESGEIEAQTVFDRPSFTLLVGSEIWAYENHQFFPISIPGLGAGLLQGSIRIPRKQVPGFLETAWPTLSEWPDVQADFSPKDFIIETGEPHFQLHLAGGLARLDAQLKCRYGNQVVAPMARHDSKTHYYPNPKNTRHYFARNVQQENRAVERLTKHGFVPLEEEGNFRLSGQTRVLNFFALEYGRLEKEWSVTLEERLEWSVDQKVERIEPVVKMLPSGEDWFQMEVTYQSSQGRQYSAADIRQILLSGQSHLKHGANKFLILDTGAVEELEDVLLDCDPLQEGGGYRVRNQHAGYLEETVLRRNHWNLQTPKEWQQRYAAFAEAASKPDSSTGPLASVLRPYQRQGVAWLEALRRAGFGGVLADEMGLGKTLQTIALFTGIVHSKESDRKPSLVVCPTSLVQNWISEISRFAPSLKVTAIEGSARESLIADLPHYDVGITSYALMRRDVEFYRGIPLDTLVLDEAQHIKNRDTQSARSVKAIEAQHRLVLTGTPMENSILDLWSIFDFLMPGYLGTASDFKERYEVPIIRDKDVQTQGKLARRLSPFLLRRNKRQVAPDLPEKIEHVAYCELTSAQTEVYEEVLKASREKVYDAVQKDGFQKSRMLVLTALLRLRQICCDLRLLDLEGVNPAEASGKMALFEELLQEALDGNHRILVFSQFTSMLAILKDALQSKEIAFAYLDGQTRHRAKEIARFQNSDDLPVFLISLKAGGVGLNLTAADTVVHFDPWWNPSVEDQATGRAHRIGQNRLVTSYKLIAKGTVEEKILSLQNRKRAIFLELLEGESFGASKLDWDDVRDLFE